jgi:hypothetical protein
MIWAFWPLSEAASVISLSAASDSCSAEATDSGVNLSDTGTSLVTRLLSDGSEIQANRSCGCQI